MRREQLETDPAYLNIFDGGSAGRSKQTKRLRQTFLLTSRPRVGSTLPCSANTAGDAYGKIPPPAANDPTYDAPCRERGRGYPDFDGMPLFLASPYLEF
jgi:hypothetical protein